MYLWKCWRDTRSFFVVFLIVSATAMPATRLVAMATGVVEEFGTAVFMPAFYLILTVMALGLGTIGALHEFADHTAQFLFTRPCSRAYFVWAGWVVGCIELLAIAGVNLAAGWAACAGHGKGLFWFLALIKGEDVLGILIDSLLVYGLTYSLTVVLRDGLKGLGAALGTMAAFQVLAIAMRTLWNIHLPVPPLRIASLPMAMSDVVWISLVLFLVFAAQFVVERVDI